ncbi:hypothetical protein L9F63_022197, partial [Diploptera punctata]
FTAWVDAVIFVFSLENEASFNAIYNYYTKMAHFRNSAEIPLILVGTQDAISELSQNLVADSSYIKLLVSSQKCIYSLMYGTHAKGSNTGQMFL